MPQVQPVAGQSSVRAEIQHASDKTGIDFDYLLGQASIESSLNPNARASTSSASGLYQFISSTWLNTLAKHGAKHGLGEAASQIEQTKNGPVVRDPAMRQQILALRYDARVSSLMAAEFADDNRATLQSALGRQPTETDLYLAHFLGPAGATNFLLNAGRNPEMAASALFPKAASANRGIFFDGAGKSRSLAEVYGLLKTKMENAIERSGGQADTAVFPGMPGPMTADFANFPIGTIDGDSMPNFFSQPGAAWGGERMRPPAPPMPPAPGRWPSMAETLRTSFGANLASNDAAGANVRKAYDVLKAFNL